MKLVLKVLLFPVSMPLLLIAAAVVFLWEEWSDFFDAQFNSKGGSDEIS